MCVCVRAYVRVCIQYVYVFVFMYWECVYSTPLTQCAWDMYTTLCIVCTVYWSLLCQVEDEPVYRRIHTDRAAQRVRQAFADVHWVGTTVREHCMTYDHRFVSHYQDRTLYFPTVKQMFVLLICHIIKSRYQVPALCSTLIISACCRIPK